MKWNTHRRHGVTLIEVTIALAVVATLIALLLSGVQRARSASAEMRTRNTIRQFLVAYQQWDERKLPDSHSGKPLDSFGGGVFPQIRQFMEIPQPWDGRFFLSATDPSAPVRIELDRGDKVPGVAYETVPVGDSSFGFNSILQRECTHLSDVSDGSSQTILLAERYAMCRNGNSRKDSFVSWSLSCSYSKDGQTGRIIPNEGGTRRATFADEMYSDIRPQTSGQPATTTGTPENIAFQTRPPLNACDPRVVQGTTTSGLLVGMADGHVQLLHRNMSPNIFWALVTPRGGESIPDLSGN